MNTVREMQQVPELQIAYDKIKLPNGRPTAFNLGGELGFRLHHAIRRLENELPYSREYILSQVHAAPGQWSNFPRVHGDIAGRWVLALTYAHAGQDAPEHLREVVDALLGLQNEDGSFGYVQFEDEPLNMHKAYGNGWMLKALAQYALTFEDSRVREAAVKLGAFYEATFELWKNAGLSEGDTQFYAISVSCYYHALDGLMTLYRLTADERFLTLAGSFIPELTPLEEADHSHMYLTSRRGSLAYLRETGQRERIDALAEDLERVYDTCILETGGVPERFWLAEGEHADDEGCSLFDWLLLCLEMFEVTGETRWLDRAILNLENHIFYNQTYNGGFGSCELGNAYKQQGKEAPWCCSLFAPYGLLEGASFWAQRQGNTVHLNHLASGTFSFDSTEGATLEVERDDEAKTLTLKGKGVQEVALYVPHWLELEGSGVHEGERYTVTLNELVTLRFHYKTWLSRRSRSPKRLESAQPGDEVALFYGPWLLTHRHHDLPVGVRLEQDSSGYVTNIKEDFLLGVGLYGESVRLSLPTDHPLEPTDTFRGVFERPGELYLYPLKTKETPNSSSSKLVWRNM